MHDVANLVPGFNLSLGDTNQVETSHDTVTHSEQTLFTVQAALRSVGMTDDAVTVTVGALQNAGILFRERA
jgi:hypothetical protein